MGMTKPDIHDYLLKRRTNLVWDDFNYYVSTDMWTTVATSAGGESVAAGNGDGGLLVLTTGGTQNNAVSARSTNKLWTFTNLKPIIFETVINYTDGDSNNAAMAFGFSSTWTAGTSSTDVLTDTAGLPQTSFSGCLFYKSPTDTVWSVITSVGSTQTITKTGMPCQGVAAGLNQVLQIQLMVLNGNVEASFFGGLFGIGGGSTGGMTNPGQLPALFPVGVAGTFPSRQIKHTVPIAGAVAMYAGAFAKNAGSGISQVCDVDYIGIDYLARP